MDGGARDVGQRHAVAVSFGAALIPILFAYGGWQNANYVAEEIENPRRNLPLSLLIGTAGVVVIYVLVNAVYLRALGLEGLAATTTPASAAAAGSSAAGATRSSPPRSRSRPSASSTWPSSRRRASTTRWRPTACSCPALARLHSEVPDAVARDRHPVHLVVHPGADRTLRAAAQLRRVRRLDLLRPDRRHRDRLPPHLPAGVAGRKAPTAPPAIRSSRSSSSSSPPPSSSASSGRTRPAPSAARCCWRSESRSSSGTVVATQHVARRT